MSIYPVRLQEWFPPKDEKREIALFILKCSNCCVCGKQKLNPKWSYIYHSAPYGAYIDKVWCSKKCLNSK